VNAAARPLYPVPGPPPSAYQTRRVVIDDVSAVHEAERAARGLARALGFADQRREQAAIAASELASNVHKHTRGGALFLQEAPGEPHALEIVAADDGPGVHGFERCLADGYSTTGTLGTGLGAVRRIASRFAAYSLPARGTVVLARLDGQPAAAHRWFEVGAFCLPVDREHLTGDGYGLVEHDGLLTLLVVDGLGHGDEAAVASRAALSLLPELGATAPEQALVALHERLRPTRGAAAAILRADPGRGEAEFCGVGNVGGAAAGPGVPNRRVVSQPGIVGRNIPRPVAQRLPLGGDTTLLMYTDGIVSRWDLDMYPGVLGHHPAALAAVLMHHHRRSGDDSTAVALRPRAAR
jgi:anti-sigma regulatory factor (Ser/Thr protein kinase)